MAKHSGKSLFATLVGTLVIAASPAAQKPRGFLEVSKLRTVQGPSFGTAVAIAGDTIAVGSPDYQGRGAVYLFEKNAGAWWPPNRVAKLTASDGSSGDEFGISVGVSGDTIVVGADRAHNQRGKLYVFEKPAGGWANMTETASLTALDFSSRMRFGYSVAIGGDTIVGGAFARSFSGTPDRGAAYVFEKPTGGWVDATEDAILTASDGATADSFGISVAISGGTIVAGAAGANVGANNNQGAAYVFERPQGSDWGNTTETAKLVAAREHASVELQLVGDLDVLARDAPAEGRGAAKQPVAGRRGLQREAVVGQLHRAPETLSDVPVQGDADPRLAPAEADGRRRVLQQQVAVEVDRERAVGLLAHQEEAGPAAYGRIPGRARVDVDPTGDDGSRAGSARPPRAARARRTRRCRSCRCSPRPRGR